jgi:PilZ domain
LQWNLIPKDLHNSLIAGQRIDRRRHLRLLVDVPAELTNQKSKRRVTGIATNIGAGGCYIQASDTFRAGTRADLLLKFDGKTFHCRAIVTHAMTCTGIGMGVAFAEANLFDWLAQLSAASSGGPRAETLRDKPPPTD